MKLTADNVHVHYGQSHALKGISMSMDDRSVTALIGPSGCGKSTFLRALNRMHDLTHGVRVRGRICLDGEDIAQYPPEQLRCRIGMLFQRPNPFPMSIYDNVAFGPSVYGVRGRELDRIVRQSLERAALWREVSRRLHTDARSLSGGQQQRLCMARALSMEPEVLLLDEPCSALDPASTHAIEELILELKSAMAIVIVTHSMAQARRVSDAIAFFQEGRLVETGPTERLLTVPSTAELAGFLSQ